MVLINREELEEKLDRGDDFSHGAQRMGLSRQAHSRLSAHLYA